MIWAITNCIRSLALMSPFQIVELCFIWLTEHICTFKIEQRWTLTETVEKQETHLNLWIRILLLNLLIICTCANCLCGKNLMQIHITITYNKSTINCTFQCYCLLTRYHLSHLHVEVLGPQGSLASKKLLVNMSIHWAYYKAKWAKEPLWSCLYWAVFLVIIILSLCLPGQLFFQSATHPPSWSLW